jgi:hypothetical protein
MRLGSSLAAGALSVGRTPNRRSVDVLTKDLGVGPLRCADSGGRADRGIRSEPLEPGSSVSVRRGRSRGVASQSEYLAPVPADDVSVWCIRVRGGLDPGTWPCSLFVVFVGLRWARGRGVRLGVTADSSRKGKWTLAAQLKRKPRMTPPVLHNLVTNAPPETARPLSP